MLVSPINIYEPTWIYNQLESRIPIKILALDQITDAHNGAAIMRTAAFYGGMLFLSLLKEILVSGQAFHELLLEQQNM